MKIDEIIQSIQIIKAQAEWDYPLDWQIVLDGAIDIMRKYQKIKEIAYPLQFCSTDKLEHEAIMKICEVLEDGNND